MGPVPTMHRAPFLDAFVSAGGCSHDGVHELDEDLVENLLVAGVEIRVQKACRRVPHFEDVVPHPGLLVQAFHELQRNGRVEARVVVLTGEEDGSLLDVGIQQAEAR